MSKTFIGEPTHDWKEAFKCPKCEDGRFRIKDDAMVCEKCGYQKPFKADYLKIPRIIDG